MTNLRDRRPNVDGAAHRDLLTASLQTFDHLYDEWTGTTRGLGQRGNMRGSHAQNPTWENELILGSMGHHPASVMTEPFCYNEDCDITCRNNQRIRDKLRDIMARYTREENPWQTDFETRLELDAEVQRTIFKKIWPLRSVLIHENSFSF